MRGKLWGMYKNVKSMISHTFKIDELPQMMNMIARDRSGVVKAVMVNE